ncbi:MBL fold metallo-hydrolase [Enterocloster lavalensis]|uniref:MBL fold metallo-hydrolase n=1 Tax=Enterocloster lavalensis TaxID=460384 RepID=UPI002A806CA0|nr:MBL fold metallo-hydrolase [Enterocloster lavalensis]
MILNFLGCGCAYRPQFGNTSAWLSVDGRLFLFDCGETVFTRLLQTGLLERCRSLTVLVTHCHADHAGSLPTLISYMHDVEQKPVAVYYPGEDVRTLMTCCGIAVDECEFYSGANIVFAPGIRCSAFPVEHHPDLHCYGYHFICGPESFYYSGDARRLPPGVLDAFLNGRIRELYQDATFLEDQGASHGSLDYLSAVIPPSLRRNVYPMHFSGDFSGQLRDRGFGVCMEPLGR